MNPLLQTITHRDEIGDWLNRNNLIGHAAEIGVMHGGYSRIVLAKWKGAKYYMVDLWARQPAEVYRERTDDIDYDFKFKDCLGVVRDYPQAVMIRDYSVKAADQIQDESLDWVFIDANHAFDAVTADLNAWFPKVKRGGLFSGHDFQHNTQWPHWCEVRPAVERWMGDRGIEFVTTPCTSWWTIKE